MRIRAVEISAITFFIGIWLGLKFSFHWALGTFGITAIAVAAVLARKSRFFIATILVCIGFFALGGFLIQPYRSTTLHHQEINEIVDHKVNICGRVSWFERLEEGVEIILDKMIAKTENSQIRLRTRLRIRIKEQIEDIGGGESVCFFGIVPRSASSYKNPGGFDYQRYLKLQGIEAVAYASKNDYEIQSRLTDPKSVVLQVRAKIRRAIDKNFSNPYRAQLKALILGEQKELSDERWDVYYISGVAHLFSISGFHIAVIAGVGYAFGWWLLRRVARPDRYIDATKFVGVLCMIPVILYTLIAGARAPSLRAAIMVGLVLLALARKRPPKLRAVVFSAALLVGLFWPSSVLTASYQLSFSAAMALVVLMPRFHKFLERRVKTTELNAPVSKRVLLVIAEAFFVSLSANIGVLPFLIFYFHRLSLIAPFANMVILPLVTLALPLIVLAGFIALIWEGFSVSLFWVVRPSLWLMDKLAELFAKVPHACAWVGTIDWWEILLYGLGFAAILAKTKRLRLLAIPLFSAIIFWELWLGFIAPTLKKDLTITFIDVGQGDSTLIEANGSIRMLIDAGGVEKGNFDVGKNAVAPVLWKKRIRSVDIATLTHPHPDHFEGLRFITRNFKVKNFWHPNLPSSDPRYKDLLDIIKVRKIHTTVVDASTSRQTLNDLYIEFINPPPQVREQNHQLHLLSLNDKSLAMRIIWKNFSLLHMGDATIEAQKLILDANRDIKSDIIKLAHHGARDAIWKDFLDSVNPKVAIISVGTRNKYGSPHAQTLSILSGRKIDVFRTDEDGAIIVNVNEKGFSVCGWSSNRCRYFLE